MSSTVRVLGSLTSSGSGGGVGGMMSIDLREAGLSEHDPSGKVLSRLPSRFRRRLKAEPDLCEIGL
jgi:hypothetical protein